MKKIQRYVAALYAVTLMGLASTNLKAGESSSFLNLNSIKRCCTRTMEVTSKGISCVIASFKRLFYTRQGSNNLPAAHNIPSSNNVVHNNGFLLLMKRLNALKSRGHIKLFEVTPIKVFMVTGKTKELAIGFSYRLLIDSRWP